MPNHNFDGNTVFEKGTNRPEFEAFFSGKSYRSDLSTHQIDISNITFSPSSRTKWHYHHSGEILLITGGSGWHQEEGQPAKHIKEGDVINIEAGTKHWHGATKNTWLSHVAITVPAENTTTDVCEEVSDDLYNQLPVF
ncbi:cupin domain-containing protein [Acinetobacter sp. B5B]|uniref:cupin domain-containing protein n=1 Tax=Acinetobacter baretiae TaxID=2605383 RepID=UPI0018C32486|nr:cupin domain-containing protein [Acinetobacter baretiae]MBF7683517.1 cupin domain-containing protein [Acinetobacter baretiae]MBF7684823.1 cupin domain-containing protein [Acinetobacter baretiae]